MKLPFPSGVTLLLAATFLPALQPQTVWVNTATQGISLAQLDRGTELGPAPSSQAITVRLALNMQNKSAAAAYVKGINDPSSSLYGQSLTPAQFAAAYGATSAQISAVTSYLKSSGFTNIVVEPNNLLISADGTVAQANKAFHTGIAQFNQYGDIVYGNTSAAQVPQALGGIVGAVLGLNNIGRMKPTLVTRTQVATPQYAVSYNPQDFWKVYGNGSTPTAANASIAIIAEGDVSQVIKDLRTAEATFKLPQVPVSVVQVGLASPDTSGLDEWDMDTQYSTGMAGTVKHLYIYTGTSLTNSDLALEINRWATQNVAKAASASLGECEFFPFLDGSMLADDNSFLQAAAQGQTFFASTGDTGSFCPVGVGTNGVPAGAPFVSYPAASPYVVGVGGTTLLADSGDIYDQEIAWYAGGGGISQFEYCPYWQSAAGVVSCQNNSKGLPDVAMDADPYSGANVYVNGSWEIVGGTSLSSPLALGVWARMISNKPKLGFAAPHLYGLYNGTVTPGAYPHGGYHDIIAGANGLYSALPGYDYTTGLGTFWVSEMYANIK
jgi:subtilase family serine protease